MKKPLDKSKPLHKRNKLAVRSEAVRALTSAQLEIVVGGNVPSTTGPCNDSFLP